MFHGIIQKKQLDEKNRRKFSGNFDDGDVQFIYNKAAEISEPYFNKMKNCDTRPPDRRVFCLVTTVNDYLSFTRLNRNNFSIQLGSGW
jgi:hypothetical protein